MERERPAVMKVEFSDALGSARNPALDHIQHDFDIEAELCRVGPSPATRAILTVLKAGETVHQTGEVL